LKKAQLDEEAAARANLDKASKKAGSDFASLQEQRENDFTPKQEEDVHK